MSHDATPSALNSEFLTRLRAFVHRRVDATHDVDDIVQDVLAKLVEHREAINEPSVYAWLFTVARRAIIDRSRSAARRSTVASLVDEQAATALADDPTVAGELSRCMEPMLKQLGSEDRAVLERVDMLGERQVDVAADLGVSVTAVKSRVQRARRRLRARLEACCAIQVDAVGRPMDFAPRPNRPCPCDGCG